MSADAYAFSRNEGRSMELAAELAGLVKAVRGQAPPSAPCPHATEEEICTGEMHSAGTVARRCPLARYRSERRRLSAQLALCGYGPELDPIATPIPDALRARLDEQRQVEGLRALVRAVDALRAEPTARAGHAALVGPVGVAKTHALLLLYFAVLQAGVRALWLTGAELCALAQLLHSYDPETAAAAQGQLLSWRKYRLLVIDDLGDRLSDGRAREAGAGRAAALLQDLLNATQARVFWSSNLKVAELRAHPDVGPRVLDRLCADHNGVPCVKVLLQGKSQRHAAAREVG